MVVGEIKRNRQHTQANKQRSPKIEPARYADTVGSVETPINKIENAMV